MQTIFIDFDGTICFDRLWRSLLEEKYKLLQEELFINRKDLVKDWMCGEYTSEEINKVVSELISVPYEDLWSIFIHDAKTQKVDLNILERIQGLRSNKAVILITGNMDHFSRFTVPSLGLDSYFDRIVNSYEEKQLKTDNNGATFLKYLKGNIKDAFLIEDSEKTIQVFSNLGGRVLQVTDNSPIEKHLSFLEEL